MKIFLLWGLLFSLTRIPFINYGQVFFDSGEYLQRLSNPNLFEALVMGHVPLHAGYILINWPVWQIIEKIGGNPALSVVIFQVFISFLGVWAFYKITSELIPKKSAVVAALFISFTPLFWVSNVVVMMESVYVSCFVLSLWMMSLFLKKREISLLVVGAILLFLSLLTHLAPLLYMPLYVFILFLISKKYQAPSPYLVSLFSVIFITFLGFSFINAYLLDQSSYTNGLKTLFFGKTQEASPLTLSFEGIGRYLRNWLIPMMRNATSILFLFSLFAMWKFYKRNDFKIFTLGLLWLLPSPLVNQWADSLWYGRHALISIFGIAFLASYILQKRIKAAMLILLYISIITFPQIFLLRGMVPYLELQTFAKDIDSDDFYIESHYARPQIEAVRSENVYYINEPRDQGNLEKRIRNTIRNGHAVYISSQALSEPYGLYSGPYIHLLTLSYRNDPTIHTILNMNGKLVEKKVISRTDNLIIYELVQSDETLSYPKKILLSDSRRRIDFFDPLLHLSFLFKSP